MRRGGGRGPDKGAGTKEAKEQSKEPEDKASAEARKVSAEADKAAVEAAKAATDARFPASKAKPLEGTVKADEKGSFVSDLIAHAMMRRAGEEIRNGLRPVLKKDGMRVLLVSSPDLIGSDWPYLAITSELQQERRELEDIRALLQSDVTVVVEETRRELEAGPQEGLRLLVAPGLMGASEISQAVQAASSIVGGVAEIAALFRADYEINAREISIDPTPLLAAVAHFLMDKVEEVNVEDFSLLKKSKLIQEFLAVARLRTEVQTLATEAKAERLAPADRRLEQAKAARAAYEDAVSDGADGNHANPKALFGRMSELEGMVARDDRDLASDRAEVAVAEAAVKRFDALSEKVLKVPDKEGYPPLIAAALREGLHTRGGHTHVLYAGIDSTGGDSISRRSYFRSSMRYLGGAQVTYMLWDVQKEKLIGADTRPFMAQLDMRLGSGAVGGIQTVPLT
ncbi:MAG TPA: hypothetical protein VFU11_12025 [Solirubrobacterales bacterium]|nr:hypothetical protein [Solirubrobacterales bacterium]